MNTHYLGPKLGMSRPVDGQLAAGVVLAILIVIGLLVGFYWSMRSKAKRDVGGYATHSHEEEGLDEDDAL
jgi:hypothetical protein